MQPHDALAPTTPQPALDPRLLHVAQLPPPPRPSSTRTQLAIAIVVAVVVGIAIGVLIGRSTPATPTAVAPSPIDLGHLGVVSKPIDGNVVVDGRFVGVAPIERLDLDPGKHSIVIDAFGFQPYSGTVEIERRGKLNLSVTLAALNVQEATTGSITGTGTAKHVVVPPSALAPPAAPIAEPSHKPGAPAVPAAPARTTPPPHAAAPPPPRRDCSGEKSRCTDNCSRAESDCRFSCPGCSSCLTSVGWDECHRQCDSCRSGCDQNTRFCKSSCDTQYENCQASQP